MRLPLNTLTHQAKLLFIDNQFAEVGYLAISLAALELWELISYGALLMCKQPARCPIDTITVRGHGVSHFRENGLLFSWQNIALVVVVMLAGGIQATMSKASIPAASSSHTSHDIRPDETNDKKS
ncbi:hypothetical protein F4804DRAFT_315918 [Jackrogersella minutella]|nr:hypothetical protein F4804DRAFT_315918 [Jackrogersella minutella]